MTTRFFVLHPDIRDYGRDQTPNPAAALRDPAGRLAEAVSLASALEGAEVAGEAVAPVSKRVPATLIGPGKVEEFNTLFDELDIDVIMVDAALTPSQQRNLERGWKRKVLDRAGLILEIFGARAHTREGVLQVDLAHLTYQKSRLVRSWTHLERQRGGAGFMGGPGETQIESDRRVIDEKITKLKRQLEKVTKTRQLHRAARKRAPYPVVALVGYTNAGKSSLFNRLTRAEVLAKDMLFATLDPTMRGVTLESGKRIALSDTVGFVSDLPTLLVAAFRATLEEVLEADVIVHVRDVSNPEHEAQRLDVLGVLADLGVESHRLDAAIEVYNKLDCLSPDEAEQWRTLAARSDAVAASAVNGEGLDALAEAIDTVLSGDLSEYHLTLPAGDGAALAWLYRQGAVRDRSDDDASIILTVRLSDQDRGQLEKTFGVRAEPVV